MNRKLCLLLASLCFAVAVVKSESYIEVDENGDEYEVKKFHIQGRQLDEGRSQCVVTRRKRSTVVIAPEDESNETNENDYQAYSQANAMLFYSPPVADDDDGDLNVEEELDNINYIKQGNAAVIPTAYADEDFGDEEDADEDDNEPETIEVVHVPQVPVIGHLQSEGQSVAAIASSPVSVSASAASSTSSVNTNGIVVVHAHKPPIVNPQTHAVFELLPVNQQSNQQGVVIGNEGQVIQISSVGFNAAEGSDEDDDLHYNEEINPVTTTAIWSTGYDNNDIGPRPTKKLKKPLKNKMPMRNKNKFNRKKPVRNNIIKNNRRGQRRPVGNKNQNIKRRPPINQKRPINKRRPNRRVNRPINKRKNNGVRNGLRRRKRPTPFKRRASDDLFNASPESNGSDDDDNEDNNASNSQINTKKKKNPANANKIKVTRRRKNKNNGNIVDQGTNTFTRTVTMTQTGDSDNSGPISCIYINKDPVTTTTTTTTTTPRPFWNIMGRSANGGVRRASGHYGKRKRVNMRLLV